MPDLPLKHIRWVDSFGCSSSWESIPPDKVAPLYVDSVGWEVYRDEHCVVLVPHITPVDHEHTKQQGCGDMTIPLVAIQSERELKWV